jgi:hypothetical protein
MDASTWQKRNLRPMGLFNASPFLRRRMNLEEIEAEKKNFRMHYYQYETWDGLLEDEIKEANILSKENPGEGAEFIKKLMSFRKRYDLGLPGTKK